MSDKIYFIMLEKKKYGPFTANEIRHLIRQRKINIESHIWRKGLEHWVKIKTLEDFSDILPALIAASKTPKQITDSRRLQTGEYDKLKKEVLDEGILPKIIKRTLIILLFIAGFLTVVLFAEKERMQKFLCRFDIPVISGFMTFCTLDYRLNSVKTDAIDKINFYGYPPLNFDLFRIRDLFEKGKFRDLRRLLAKIDKDHKKNYRKELSLLYSYRAFAILNPDYKDYLKKWMRLSPPQYYHPILARGVYNLSLALKNRDLIGDKIVQDDDMGWVKKNLSVAEKDFKRVIELKPDNFLANLLLITLYRYEGDYSKLQKVFDKASDMWPQSYLIRAHYMDSVKEQLPKTFGDFSSTSSNLLRIKKPNQRFNLLNGLYHQYQAEKLIVKKEYWDAYKLLTKALEFGDSWRIYYRRAQLVLKNSKHYMKAVHDIDASLRLNPLNIDSYLLRAEVLFNMGREDKAYKDIKDAEELDSFNMKSLVVKRELSDRLIKKGYKFFENKKYFNANKAYENAFKFDNKNWIAYYYLALTSHKLQNHKKALFDLNKAIKNNPGHYPSYKLLDKILFRRRQYRRMVKEWSKYIATSPKDPKAYLNRGKLYYHLKLRRKMLKDYRKACYLGSKLACEKFDKSEMLQELNR